jgi:phosphoesterase RecJ-like protein
MSTSVHEDQRTEITEALADPDVRWAVTSHVNPDGDALGSLLGAGRALAAAGRDVVLAHPNGHELPDDIAFLIDEDEVVDAQLPADVAGRTLLVLDCASEARLWPGSPPWGAARVINIDHHHDNTRFGQLNLVAPTASSAAEVAYELLLEAGIPIGERAAEALYVGLITDTGRFSYSNTTPRSHHVAAELMATGINHTLLAQKLYEHQPEGRIRLLGRAIDRSTRLMDGSLMVAALHLDDFASIGANDTETIVEVLRSVDGVESAALARELPDGQFRLSLRTLRSDLDVSVIARAEGGGGHRAAAGFTTARRPPELFEWIAAELAAQADD